MGILRVCGGGWCLTNGRDRVRLPNGFLLFCLWHPPLIKRAQTHTHTHTGRMQPYIHLNLL